MILVTEIDMALDLDTLHRNVPFKLVMMCYG